MGKLKEKELEINGVKYNANKIIKDFEYYLNNDLKTFATQHELSYVLQKIDDYIRDVIYYDFKPFKSFQEAQFALILCLTGEVYNIRVGGDSK